MPHREDTRLLPKSAGKETVRGEKLDLDSLVSVMVTSVQSFQVVASVVVLGTTGLVEVVGQSSHADVEDMEESAFDSQSSQTNVEVVAYAAEVVVDVQGPQGFRLVVLVVASIGPTVRLDVVVVSPSIGPTVKPGVVVVVAPSIGSTVAAEVVVIVVFGYGTKVWYEVVVIIGPGVKKKLLVVLVVTSSGVVNAADVAVVVEPPTGSSVTAVVVELAAAEVVVLDSVDAADVEVM